MSAISLPKIKSSSVCVVSMWLCTCMWLFSVATALHYFLREYTGTLTVLASLESYRWGCVMEACGFILIL